MTSLGHALRAADIPFASANDDRFQRVSEGHYILTSNALLNTDLEINHVRRERHQLHGELTVHTGLTGMATVGGVVFTASLNLSNLRDRDAVAYALSARARTPQSDLATWKALVDELCIRVRAAETTGSPSVMLCDVPKRGPERWLRALGFTLPEHLPAMLFGDGDSLKTMAADAMAVELARQGIATGIVDAEMTAEEHADRVAKMSPIVPTNLVYLSCSRPLIHERDRIVEMIRQHQLSYLIFDSVAFLCHDKPEFAESAMEYFRAVRSFGLGSLSIAHINRGDQSDTKPFGSTFWFNSVRALWFAKRAEAGDASITEVGFYPRKFNLGVRPGAHALRFAFSDTRIGVTQIDAASVESLAVGMTLKDRALSILRGGALDLDALHAEMPDVDKETLSRTIRRHTGDKAKSPLFVKLADDRIGLVDRRRA